MSPRIVEVRQAVLKKNDLLARELRPAFRVAALVGDLATDNDAQRLERSGALMRQITTGTVCHLDAEMIEAALRDWDLASLDFLFLENVGNLVCPSSYDSVQRPTDSNALPGYLTELPGDLDQPSDHQIAWLGRPTVRPRTPFAVASLFRTNVSSSHERGDSGMARRGAFVRRTLAV